MPEREQQTAATAGISPPEEVDVAALFARLREEVRHAPGLDVSNGFNRGVVRTRLRTVAERFWPVTAQRPLERQRAYGDGLREAAPVLDVGCGRGEFLALLREAGVEARGVDADADMVAFARGEGLDVEQGDALAALAALADGSLGGIFLAQVVEHLPPTVLVRLLELAHAKLRP